VPEPYGIVLLAAGLSSRFAAGDKLLHPWHGKPLLAWAVANVGAAPVALRLAVVGPDDTAKRAIIEAAGIPCVVNPSPAQGMGSSLAIGARALPEDLAGVFVVLGDMPALPVNIFEALIAAYRRTPGCTAAAPSFEGQRGHPVLFGAAHLAGLRALHGDEGARAVLRAAGSSLLEVPVTERGVLSDFDTVESFAESERAR